MPRHPQARVDVAGVLAVNIAEGLAKAILVARHGNDVDVIGHQAIRPHLHPVPPRRLGQQVAIKRKVCVLKERQLTPVATLGDVMGRSESIMGFTDVSP